MSDFFCVNGKFNLKAFILLTFMPLLAAFFISYTNKDSFVYFQNVNKPFFSPPPIVFIIVWTILYLIMGFASYRVYLHGKIGHNIGSALFYYLLQLLLNYLWFYVFFAFRLYGLSLIELIILFIFILITFIKFIKIDKLSGVLFIPYVLWVTFAIVLNYFIWVKNEM